MIQSFETFQVPVYLFQYMRQNRLGMTDLSTEELVAAYLDDRDRDELFQPAEKTSAVIRSLTAALVDEGPVGTTELTALYRLCMNSRTYPVSSKRGELDELEISEELKRSLREQIDEEIGTVGGLLFPVEVPDDKVDVVTSCLETIVHTDDETELDEAVGELARLDLPKVECGKLSPIFHYLHPEYYPVVNTLSRTGMSEYFDGEISNALLDYPETAATYRSVRGSYEFDNHFRDLDFFFIWANQRAKSRGTVPLDDDQSYYWVNQGNLAEIEDGYLRAKVDGIWHHDLGRASKGDLVFHNFDDELIGISMIEGEPETYVFRGQEYQRVSVESRWFDDPIAVDDDLKESLNDERFQAKYFPVDGKGNLKQAYLSDLTPEAVGFLLDRAQGWKAVQALREHKGESVDIPAKPAGADRLERQLRSKKQVVLYGPPGTGKTFVAERFAKWWVGQQEGASSVSERVEVITFHPSFTYEDFVEGLTVEKDADGQVTYEVQDGSLKRICTRARKAYEAVKGTDVEPTRFVLIIDEINRGNLAQIFGEAITLLEADKREAFDVDLAHSGETFTIPPNLYLIGTMNTADQSIALVDTALRRRFRFIGVPPDLRVVFQVNDTVTPDPRSAVTRRSGDISRLERLLGASVLAVDKLNGRILRTPDLGKGKQLGHAYLLGLHTESDIVDAWRFDILPQLEEYYFGQPNRLRDDLLTETGDRLIDWDNEQILPFDAQDLYDALCQLSGIEDPAPLGSLVERPVADGSGASSSFADLWERGEKTPAAFRERIDQRLDDDAVRRINRILDAGEEMGWLDTGRGDRRATAQIKSEAVDPGIGLVQIDQDGSISFRWNWLHGREENDLTAEFIDEAATEFTAIKGYSHEWDPDAGENGEFVKTTINVAEITDEDVTTLLQGLRSFIDRAREFQNG